jgi:hypothetical protein
VVVAAAGAAAVAKAGSKPATTIVKTGATPARTATVKPAVAAGGAVVPGVAAVPAAQFQEERSTTLTTVLAAVLAVVTWGTAGVLIASYLSLF